MNDDLGAAEAANPATTDERLAALAAERPDLGAIVAQHPNAYDGLLDWLATYGDENAQRAVAARRSPEPAASAAPAPVPDSAASAPDLAASAPMAPQAGPSARAFPISKGLLIGLVAGGAALVVAIATVTWVTVSNTFSGSSSPQAAVEKLIGGATELDPLALFTSLAPSEISTFRPAVEQLRSISGDVAGVDYDALAKELMDAADITLEGLKFETEYIMDDVAIVRLTAGVITVDGDSDRLAATLTELNREQMTMQYRAWGYSSREIEDRIDDFEDSLADQLYRELPFEFDVYDVVDEFDYYGLPSPIAVVVVKEGGWYVSPMLTSAEASFAQLSYAAERWGYSDVPRRGRSIVEAARFDTPQAALEGAAAAVERFTDNGRIEGLAAVLPLAERRLLSIYGPAVADPLAIRDSDVSLSFRPLDFDIEVKRDIAYAEIVELGIRVETRYDTTNLNLRGWCWRVRSENRSDDRGCLDDLPFVRELRLDESRLVLVRENGSWLLSPVATLGEIGARAADAIATLAREDRLEDLWRN